MTLYKALTGDDCAPHADFDFAPNLPVGGEPGPWLPKVEQIELCVSGWHGCEHGDILEYLHANIYEIEMRGEIVKGTDKFTAQQIRFIRKCGGWNETSARLFACDCAERVLPIYENAYPDDPRPRYAIAVARAYARGEASLEELGAARAAAWDAEADAVRAAAWAARAARNAARDTSWYAAGYAAWDAAWYAARDAAGYAEKKWQADYLLELLK